MIREVFAGGTSPVHRIDPRVKVVFATLFSCVTAVSMRFPALLAALATALVLVAAARLPWRDLLKRVLMVNGLVVLFWVALPFTFEGEPLFTIGPLTATRAGVVLAAQITLKSNAIVLALVALLATSPVPVIGEALSRLRVPPKIVHLLLLTYRYFFVIDEEYRRLYRAAKIRGFRPGTNLHSYRTFAYLIGMLLVRAWGRAQRVQQAMLCRGFKGRFYCLQEFRAGRADWLWAAGMTAAIVGVAVLEWTTIT
jgi:cobalt/nickel transport system permease protein